MQRDLAALPAWLSREVGDKVLCPANTPQWSERMPLVPEADLLRVGEKHDINEALSLELWGQEEMWRRYAVEQCLGLSLELHSKPVHPKLSILTHRRQSAHCLHYLHSHLGYSVELIPHWYNGIDHFKSRCTEDFRSDTNLLLKVPYSSSGRGLFWINDLTKHDEWERIERFTSQYNEFSVEPQIEIVQDLAMEFMVDANSGTSFVAYSLFETGQRGAYLGNRLADQSQLARELCQYVSIESLKSLQEQLCFYFDQFYTPYYKGYIGVDMALYRSVDGIRLHPCIEINPRCTMGLLAALLYHHYLLEGAEGIFRVDSFKAGGMAKQFADEASKEHPAKIIDGRLSKGFLPLSPFDEENRFLAYVILS